MIRNLLLSAAISTALAAAALPAPVHAQASASETRSTLADNTPESRALHALFDAEWERGMRESPETASYRGDHRFNDRWSDLSLEALRARQAADRAALEKLRAIDRDALSEADRLSYDVFAWQLERSVERQKYNEWQRPLSQRGGIQTAEGIAEVLPFRDADDYRDWIKRLEGIPTLVEQTTGLMREGLAAGNTPPRVLMERVPGQIESQLVDDPTESPFYKPFTRMPDSIPAAERQALQASAQKAIRESVIPAYRDFNTFFNDEYLPVTRETIAAVDMPDGKAYYDFLVGQFTTTDLTADEVHQIGLKEVARIRAEMEQVRQEIGFDGDLAAFFEHLRTDPDLFYDSPEALLEAYQAMSKRIDPELVKVFKTIPRLPYGVRPIPDNIAPDTTTAYYQPGAVDGTRAGYYYVNLYKPEVRPKWEMMALSLHEAVPGHHFQFARGQELGDVPMFRRVGYFTAYGEGWGLYAERLGYDMGLYDDPYDRMGQLAYDMWRAVRLVVDTGMHSKGWSRQQAIDYFMDNSPKTLQDVTNEIDRYIGWPGQALAYKIGQLKISELRADAERELGDDFDLRAFNDAVLSTGSVPLETLERHMREWIAGQMKG
ncbi:DUF885 domain-containing protein [Novilysobacter selenitireducens]|uniref:DUF885 domain-containing protein n=1 Tax=Novilysobacter selenitireducens TaxID=2872639 RepID=A0ABS7T592_9GAMM|nr:DUF885 domain-containing protein [Lysobacter selenitireducens]MBZ4039015.1 DUF885 domain-containing protein [Lysobacter selenitireducens]